MVLDLARARLLPSRVVTNRVPLSASPPSEVAPIGGPARLSCRLSHPTYKRQSTTLCSLWHERLHDLHECRVAGLEHRETRYDPAESFLMVQCRPESRRIQVASGFHCDTLAGGRVEVICGAPCVYFAQSEMRYSQLIRLTRVGIAPRVMRQLCHQ